MTTGNNASRRVKEVVRERGNGLCEVCGRFAPGADVHHRLAKGMGGTSNPNIHSAENLIAVCGFGNTSGCHGRIHGNADFAKAMGHTISRFSPYEPGQIPVRLWDGLFYLNPDGTRTAAVDTQEGITP